MQPLIRLEGVTKKFLTDEVETHALAGIHLDINSGEWVSISGPSGCGSPRCSRFWPARFAQRRRLLAQREARVRPENGRAVAHS